MLDFQLWKCREDDPTNPGEQRETLRYSFFEKAMSNPEVMNFNSAMPHRTKIASMTQEGVRRLANTSRELEASHCCDILARFMLKLKRSGYPQVTRSNILQGSVKTFRRKLRAEHLKIRPVHRLSTHEQDARRRAKLTGKSSWYLPTKKSWKHKLSAKEKELASKTVESSPKQPLPQHTTSPTTTNNTTFKHNQRKPTTTTTPNSTTQPTTQSTTNQSTTRSTTTKPTTTPPNTPPNSHIEGIMFVPHTPGGGLARELQKEEDNFSKLHRVARVKIVERGGKKVKDILGKKDPWAPSTCFRPDCMVCNSTDKKLGTPTTCKQEGVCYQISCDRCKEKGITAHYFGESSRTPFLRGREHLKGQSKKLEENPLAKHDFLHHNDQKGPYSMTVLRRHKAPLGRQVQEAVEIECSKAQYILNSKGEFNGVRVPRVTIEVGGRVLSGEYRGHDTDQQADPEEQHSEVVRSWEKDIRQKPTLIKTTNPKRDSRNVSDPPPKQEEETQQQMQH